MVCVYIEGLWSEWLQRSRVLPREPVCAATVLFVFHCCSNNGSPWADSSPNWETTERKRARGDGAAFTSAQLHTHTNVYVGMLANWHIYVRVVLYKHYTLVIKVLQSHCTFSTKHYQRIHTHNIRTPPETHTLCTLHHDCIRAPTFWLVFTSDDWRSGLFQACSVYLLHVYGGVCVCEGSRRAHIYVRWLKMSPDSRVILYKITLQAKYEKRWTSQLQATQSQTSNNSIVVGWQSTETLITKVEIQVAENIWSTYFCV